MTNQLKYLYRAYRYKNQLDSAEIKYIVKHLKKGDTALDIGCHKGGYLYWMRRSVGKNGKIYAFEPQPQLFRYTQSIIKKFNWKNVELINKGISSEVGKTTLHIPNTKKGTSPGARIDWLESDAAFDKIEIDLTTLDNYCAQMKIRPSLIKIDVEGHEKQVLLGGLNILKKHRPKIVLECENRHLQNESVFDVFKILLNIGYQGFFFDGNIQKPLASFDMDTHQSMAGERFWAKKNYVNNFIFE